MLKFKHKCVSDLQDYENLRLLKRKLKERQKRREAGIKDDEKDEDRCHCKDDDKKK